MEVSSLAAKEKQQKKKKGRSTQELVGNALQRSVTG